MIGRKVEPTSALRGVSDDQRHLTDIATEENGRVVTRRRPQPQVLLRETVREIAPQLRDILDAVERAELVAEPGLIARLEGAALALEALAEVQQREQ